MDETDDMQLDETASQLRTALSGVRDWQLDNRLCIDPFSSLKSISGEPSGARLS